MDYLSLCLLIKDENEYLREWLDYHILMGVERFYIYDNQSLLPVKESIADYIDRGWVHVVEVPGPGVQLGVYDHCLNTFGTHTQWLGFIDTDEFIVPKVGADLRIFLKDYEPFGGLTVSSAVFGSGGHLEKPVGGQIFNYKRRTLALMERALLVKSIVQPGKTLFPTNPHMFAYKPESYAVNEQFERVDSQKSPFRGDRIQVNHYYCRSQQEFLDKQARGRGDAGYGYDLGNFSEVDQLANHEDLCIFSALERTPEAKMFLPFARALQEARQGEGKDSYLESLSQAASHRQPVPAVFPSVDVQENSPAFRDYWTLFQAGCKAEAEQSAKALEIFSDLQAQFPNHVEIYTFLIRLCLGWKQYDAAYQWLEAAWKIAPGSYALLGWYREYYAARGEFPHAEQFDRMQLKISDGDFRVQVQLIADLTYQRRLSEAADLLLIFTEQYAAAPSLVERMSDHLELYKRIGVYLALNGHKWKAAEVFEAALQFQPDDLDLLINLGGMKYDLGSFQQALEYLERANWLCPGDENVLLGLAHVRRALGTN